PAVRGKRPEVAVDLEQVIHKLMALDPQDRYASPQAVRRALMPFLKCETGEHMIFNDHPRAQESPGVFSAGTVCSLEPRNYQVLLADDETDIRNYCKYVLQAEGMTCDEADSGQEALRKARAKNYDLIVLDINLGDMNGTDLCRELR